MVGKAVMTAMRMGAVCRAPTWVKNAAIKTMANGAAASAPTVAASRQANDSPSGTPGMTWWTRTPAVPPMNSDGRWPAHEAAAQADGEREHLGDERGGDQAQAERPRAGELDLELVGLELVGAVEHGQRQGHADDPEDHPAQH